LDIRIPTPIVTLPQTFESLYHDLIYMVKWHKLEPRKDLEKSSLNWPE
jgi:hypothetical protein